MDSISPITHFHLSHYTSRLKMNTIHAAGHFQKDNIWHRSIDREISFKAALMWFLAAGLIVDRAFDHPIKGSGTEIDQIRQLQGDPLAVQLTHAADIIYNKFYRQGTGCALLSDPSSKAHNSKLVWIDRYDPGLNQYRVILRGCSSDCSSEQTFLVCPQHLRPHETSHGNDKKSKLQSDSHCVSLTSVTDPHQTFRLEFWCFQFDLFRPSFENNSQSNLQNLLDAYRRSVSQHDVRLLGKKRQRDLPEHRHLKQYSATDFSKLLVISTESRIRMDPKPLSQGLGLLDRNNLDGADFQEKIIQGVALFGRLSIYRASMVTLDDGHAINDEILNFLMLW